MMLEFWYQPPRYVCNARTVDVKLLPYTSWLSVWIWIKMQSLSFTTNVSCNNTTESKVRLHHELPHQCCRWAAASKSCTTPPFSSISLIFLVSTILDPSGLMTSLLITLLPSALITSVIFSVTFPPGTAQQMQRWRRQVKAVRVVVCCVCEIIL